MHVDAHDAHGRYADIDEWFRTCRSRVGRCVASVVVVVVVKHIISGWWPQFVPKVKPAERGNSLPSSTQVYGATGKLCRSVSATYLFLE